MRQIPVFFLSLVLISVLNSCRSDTSDTVSAGEFSGILQNTLSSDSIPIGRIKKIDPYESYFLALQALELGHYDAAVMLARHCWKNSDGFISERAAELSVEMHMENQDYKEAEFLSSIASAEFPGNYGLRRAVVEARYWQEESEAVLDGIAGLEKLEDAESDGELLLFRAVSAFRAEVPGWQGEWIRLFKEASEPEYIRRGWSYLSGISGYSFEDFAPESELFRARYAHSTGKYNESVEAYENYFGSVSPGSVSPAVIEDFENLYIKRGARASGAQLLEQAGEGLADFQFAAARLYRRAGRYVEADRCMDSVIEMSKGNYSDRLLWYSLDIKCRRNLSTALDSLDFYIQHWDEPGYFADSLDNLCTSLAGRRRWDSITELALKLESSGPVAVYDRCRYISSRAAALGWTARAEFSGEYSEPYYRILTGSEPFPEYRLSDQQKLAAVCTDPPEADNEYERYISGLIRYNSGRLTEEVRKYRAGLSEDFLAWCAGESVNSGENLDSIRIMYQFSGRYTELGYRALYPDLYRSEIEDVSTANDIPPQLMFALVWKESGFENDIVSRSGAVGLSQLMPATAEDVAHRQRRELGDLTDPVENLELGAWYLNWLKGYAGNTAAAVISYNGGPGRVKRWKESWRSLPDDLLYEVVPVAETHAYGKMVLEASVIYGMLYYGITPEQTLKLFFNGVSSI